MPQRAQAGDTTTHKKPIGDGSAHAASIAIVLDKVLQLLAAGGADGGVGRLFPQGVDLLYVRAAAGDTSLELKLSGGSLREYGASTGLSLEIGTTAEREASFGVIAAAAAFVQLPQGGNGYYSYSPAANQFGTQATIDTLTDIGRQWQTNALTPFGVGDISLQQGGPMPGHTTGHRIGRNVDLRPMRTDGQRKPVTWQHAEYSRELTQLLVDNFRAHANVTKIFFNDPQVTGVQPLAGHDNHLHVEMKS